MSQEILTPLSVNKENPLPKITISPDTSVEGDKNKEKEDRKIKYIIADLDGTLINVMQEFGNIFVDEMRKLGVFKKRAHRYFIRNAGQLSEDQVRGLLEQEGLDLSLSEERVEKTIQNVRNRRSKQKGRTFLGVRRALENLVNDGFVVAVSTNAKEQDAKEKLKHAKLDDLVATVVGRDSGNGVVLPRKGMPHLKVISERLNIPISDLRNNSVYLVDTVQDVIEVAGDNIMVIGVSDIASNRISLLKAGVNFVIDANDFIHLPYRINDINVQKANSLLLNRVAETTDRVD